MPVPNFPMKRTGSCAVARSWARNPENKNKRVLGIPALVPLT